MQVKRLNIKLKHVAIFQVAIVSVTGDYGTGKSFLLTLFMRYLRYLHSPPEYGRWQNLLVQARKQALTLLELFRQANELPDWLQCGGALKPSEGFLWDNTDATTTEGMWMCAHPFRLGTAEDSEDITVLLVDTAGLHATGSNQNMLNTIFGLSTLISSHQIYFADGNHMVSSSLCFTCIDLGSSNSTLHSGRSRCFFALLLLQRAHSNASVVKCRLHIMRSLILFMCVLVCVC
jgi:Guanylate-binding protein, N-terminal domain